MVLGKTEQRVQRVITVLQELDHPVTYEYLMERTGSTYDSLLYILATLAELGKVDKLNIAEGPGRPRVHFAWRGRRRSAHEPGS